MIMQHVILKRLVRVSLTHCQTQLHIEQKKWPLKMIVWKDPMVMAKRSTNSKENERTLSQRLTKEKLDWKQKLIEEESQ